MDELAKFISEKKRCIAVKTFIDLENKIHIDSLNETGLKKEKSIKKKLIYIFHLSQTPNKIL